MPRIFFLVLSAIIGLAAADPDPLAAADARGGLIVVVAPQTKDGSWIATLAASGRAHVHVLVRDAATASGLRKALLERDQDGTVLVQMWAGGRLPHVRDLADTVLVVEAGAIAAAEAERAARPDGIVATRSASGWAVRTKPQRATLAPWTMINGDPGSTRVSTDGEIRPPFSPRWIAGEPQNRYSFTDCRGVLVGSGRYFAVTLLPMPGKTERRVWVEARNAWNGFPLWQVDIGPGFHAGTNRVDFMPFALVGERLLVRSGDGLSALAIDDGRTVATYPVSGVPNRLVVDAGTVVVAVSSKGAKPGAASAGDRIEAFTLDGKPLWTKPGSATLLQSHRGNLLYQVKQAAWNAKQSGPENAVVALDLATGAERWRFSDAPAALNCAGDGVVIIQRLGFPTAVVSIADGRRLWEIPSTGKNGKDTHTGTIRDGEVWSNGERRAVLTGEVKGTFPRMQSEINGGLNCTPGMMIGTLVTHDRMGQFFDLASPVAAGKTLAPLPLGPIRGHCMQGIVPALGSLFSAPNLCSCVQYQLRGTVSIGNDGPPPTAAQWSAPRPVEAGAAPGVAITSGRGWATFRGGEERNSTSAAGPTQLGAVRWRVTVAPGDSTPIGRDALRGQSAPITAPVLAEGLAIAAAVERGRLVAVDRATGSVRWTVSLPGRIDAPPTVLGDSAVVGCHDGWVSSLALADGAARWRTRAAPDERSLVVRGRIESAWPVVGSPLLHDGLLYAVCGRTVESDGGLGLVAIDPRSGATASAISLGSEPGAADVAAWFSDGIAINDLRVAVESAPAITRVAKAKPKVRSSIGFVDTTWTSFPKVERRMGRFQTGVAAWTPTRSAQATLKGPITVTDAAGERKVALPTAMTAIHALVLAGDTLVIGGAGAEGGRIALLDAATGTIIAELALPSAVISDGVAVDAQGICVATADGALSMIGK